MRHLGAKILVYELWNLFDYVHLHSMVNYAETSYDIQYHMMKSISSNEIMRIIHYEPCLYESLQ